MTNFSKFKGQFTSQTGTMGKHVIVFTGRAPWFFSTRFRKFVQFRRVQNVSRHLDGANAEYMALSGTMCFHAT